MYLKLKILFSCLIIYSCTGFKIISNSTRDAEKLEIPHYKLPKLIEIEEESLLQDILSHKENKLIFIWWSSSCGVSLKELSTVLNDTNFVSYNICCDYNTIEQRELIQKFLFLENIKTSTYIVDNSAFRILFTFDFKNSSNTEDFIKKFNPDFEISNKIGKTDLNDGSLNGYYIPHLIILNRYNNIIYESNGNFEIDSVNYYLSLE